MIFDKLQIEGFRFILTFNIRKKSYETKLFYDVSGMKLSQFKYNIFTKYSEYK